MAISVNKGLSLQSSGSSPGTWGVGAPTALNEGVFNVLDTNLAGLSTFSVSSLNVTLSITDVRNCIFRFTSTLTANIIVSPDTTGSPSPSSLFNGFYYFENLTTGNFSITLTTSIGSVVLPQSRRGVVIVDATNGPRIFAIVGATNADPIPVGTVMVFYQNAAPAGWTISSALNDYALSIVSSGGGVTTGSVAYSTLFGRTATDGYTLQIADIPPHTHTTPTGSSAIEGFTSGNTSQQHDLKKNPSVSGSTGGGGPHSHNIDMRVQTASVILATKQ